MPLADFLDSFLSSRKVQHISLILLKKLQEVIELKSTQRLSEIQRFSAGFPEQILNTCLPLCSLSTAVVLPACCHPPFLLPFGTHVNTRQCLQHLPFCHDHNESPRAGVHGRGPRWPARPVRLQPLRAQQRRHQQAPQWSLIFVFHWGWQSENSYQVKFPQHQILKTALYQKLQLNAFTDFNFIWSFIYFLQGMSWSKSLLF